MNFKNFTRAVVFGTALFMNEGCTNLSSSSSGSSHAAITGVASAGLISGATVTAYTLTSSGANGTTLSSTTTDSSGNFSLPMLPQSAPVVIVVTGGSYSEEASGSTVNLGVAQLRLVLPSTTAAQKVGVTPLTEIAAQNALAAIANNTTQTLTALINISNQTVASAMGLSDITISPANSKAALSLAGSTQAAQYAIVLGTISQLANSASLAGATVNSLDVTQALATSLTYNGSFAAAIGSTAIPVPNSSGQSTLPLATVLNNTTFTAAMAAASTAYLASGADPSYSATGAPAAPTYNATPGTPTGATAIVLPATPSASALPYRPPEVAGPPFVAGSATATAPTIVYSGAGAVVIGTKSSAMNLLPTQLLDNGALISSCSVSPSLPAGLQIDSDCRIYGTPTAPTATASYAITATNSVGSSAASLSITILDITPHIYISDSGAVLVCAVSATTGAVGTCLGHQGGNAFSGAGLTALMSGNVWSLYIAGGDRINMCSVDSDDGQVSFAANGNSSLSHDTIAVTHTIGANSFAYAIDDNGINVCPINTDGTVGACAVSNSNLTPATSASTAHAQWSPAGIDLYTTTSNVTYAYVSDLQGGGIYVCNVSATTGVLSGCAQSSGATLTNLYAATQIPASTSGGVGVSALQVATVGANTYLYIAGEIGNIYKCTISATDGSLSACVATQGGVATYTSSSTASAWEPVSIFLSSLGGISTYAYVSDQQNNKVYMCAVSATDGTLSGCAAQITSGLKQPVGAVVF